MPRRPSAACFCTTACCGEAGRWAAGARALTGFPRGSYVRPHANCVDSTGDAPVVGALPSGGGPRRGGRLRPPDPQRPCHRRHECTLAAGGRRDSRGSHCRGGPAAGRHGARGDRRRGPLCRAGFHRCVTATPDPALAQPRDRAGGRAAAPGHHDGADQSTTAAAPPISAPSVARSRRVQPAVNVVQMIGHNAVRQAVLGSADREPDARWNSSG
jgi:hypothetical protein